MGMGVPPCFSSSGNVGLIVCFADCSDRALSRRSPFGAQPSFSPSPQVRWVRLFNSFLIFALLGSAAWCLVLSVRQNASVLLVIAHSVWALVSFVMIVHGFTLAYPRPVHHNGELPRDIVVSVISPSNIPIPAQSDTQTPLCAMYCPICMVYYDRILVTSCCRHHVCHACASDWARGKGIHLDLSDINSVVLPCPHCMQEKATVSEVVVLPARRYEDSPGVVRQRSNRILPSPLKIGDGLERMKAKMLTFESDGYHKKSATPPPPRIFFPGSEISDTERNGLDDSQRTEASVDLGSSQGRRPPRIPSQAVPPPSVVAVVAHRVEDVAPPQPDIVDGQGGDEERESEVMRTPGPKVAWDEAAILTPPHTPHTPPHQTPRRDRWAHTPGDPSLDRVDDAPHFESPPPTAPSLQSSSVLAVDPPPRTAPGAPRRARATAVQSM